jgi:hypothetical protein
VTRTLSDLHRTAAEGMVLFHPEVAALGAGVASGVAALIRKYSEAASVSDLPPITLAGEGWDKPWATISLLTGCAGESGPSKEAEQAGVRYACLELSLPTTPAKMERDRADLYRKTLENVVAHEITHLRWPRLEHSPEFEARVLALLRAARFPSHAGWSKATREIVKLARQEAITHGRRLLGLLG